jgi:hypothetical protein
MSKSSLNDESSDAEFYGLSEIPFEPTAASTDKYPYVAPQKFSLIEDKIHEIVKENKIYVVLLRSPQGGGKSSTVAELRRRVQAKKYTTGKSAIIVNRLGDLNFSNYADEFMEEAQPLSPDIKWEKYLNKTQPGELRNSVYAILKHLGEKNKLLVWVIDEFDIMVDAPKQKQSEFLQYLREIIDDLSEHNLPILFVMSHTVKSSKEFEKHLRDVHGPFQSRIVATIDLGYSYPEARAIVAARLRARRKQEQAFNSILPFSEEALRALYNFVLFSGGSADLNDFRLFERCCYFAILNGAKKKRKEIDKDDAQEEFQRQFKPYSKTESGEKYSLQVRSELAGILAGPQMGKNDSTLRGLIAGFKLMKNLFSEITGVQTRDGGKISQELSLSSLEFNVHIKHTGKKVSAVWILAAKDNGIIFQDDLVVINSAISKHLSEHPSYSNLSVLSYVSDLDLDASKVTNSGQLLRISPETMHDLIGLSIENATQADIDVLRKTFDSEIGPFVSQVFEESTRDITDQLSERGRRVVMALNVGHAAGVQITRVSLKEEEKKLFGSASKASDSVIKEIFDLGFAKEEGTQIVPTAPKAFSHLNEMLKDSSSIKDDKVSDEFGPNGESVLKAAKALGIISLDNNKVSKKKQELKGEVDLESERIKPLLTETSKESFNGMKTQEILKAVKSSSSDESLDIIILSAAHELLPALESELAKIPSSSPPSHKDTASLANAGSNQSSQKPTSKVEPSHSKPGARAEMGKTERAILELLEGSNPLTIEELKHALIEKEFSSDVNGIIIGMIMKNKIKLAA